VCINITQRNVSDVTETDQVCEKLEECYTLVQEVLQRFMTSIGLTSSHEYRIEQENSESNKENR
jgi:hypothetical protein